MKRIIVVLLMILILTGCGKSESEDQMYSYTDQFKSVNGYQVYYREFVLGVQCEALPTTFTITEGFDYEVTFTETCWGTEYVIKVKDEYIKISQAIVKEYVSEDQVLATFIVPKTEILYDTCDKFTVLEGEVITTINGYDIIKGFLPVEPILYDVEGNMLPTTTYVTCLSGNNLIIDGYNFGHQFCRSSEPSLYDLGYHAKKDEVLYRVDFLVASKPQSNGPSLPPVPLIEIPTGRIPKTRSWTANDFS